MRAPISYFVFLYLCTVLRLKKITALLLLLVMGFFIASNTLFIHSHTIDGKHIVHSHPFSGAASSHSHNSTSLYAINRILNPDILCAENIALNSTTTVSVSGHLVVNIDSNYLVTTHKHQLRAPPAKA